MKKSETAIEHMACTKKIRLRTTKYYKKAKRHSGTVGTYYSEITFLYKKITNIVTEEFEKIANPIAEDIYNECFALGFKGKKKKIDVAWVDEFFREYNPVTRYIFANEIDRKKSRLFEALIANELERLQSYKQAEKLIHTQVRQYSIDLEDAVVLTVFKVLGVKKVQWVAEDDHKTCGVCNELDGQVFDIEKVPPKQHYNCRCYLVPVKE